MNYIARRKCGCICFASVIYDASDKNYKARCAEQAKEIATLVRQGMTIETVDNDAIRNGSWSCAVCDQPKATKSMFDALTQATKKKP